MADNVVLQSAAPSTPPPGTPIACAQVSFSGDTVQAGIGLMGKSTGAEGARVLTLVDPATEAGQDMGNASLAAIDGKTPALVGGAVPVVGPLTDAELRATPVPVSGAVSTGGLTDAQLRATPVPVDGPLTDAELRATPVPVSGTVATGGLTDAQLRATPVPVDASGSTVIAVTGGLTDTQLRATPVPVTANAGTNLNTSALALEAGGNLAAAAASLAIIDDWDESDRAKVNPIVGQAGVAAGAGAVAATVQRMTLASDDPAVAVLGATSGAKVITDAAGTIQQYLRGLVSLAVTAGSFLVTATLAAGANLIGYVGLKSTYGGKVTITSTNWVSLTSGNAWQSDAIATSGARDVHFWLQSKSAGAGTYFQFYIEVKLSNGTGYTDGATGSEGTFTAGNRLNGRFLGSVRVNNAIASGFFALSDIFPGAIPANVVLLGINASGNTISATASDTVFEYELVN